MVETETLNILAAILVLSASGHAERSMETDASIGRIVAQCGAGLFHDARLVGRTSGLREKTNGFLAGLEAADFRLTIDGQPREGLRAWGEAAWRVGGYVGDFRDDGSVGYSYRLRVRGYDIRRSTWIADEHIVLTTDAWWTERVPVTKRITRRIPIHVTIRITADERSTGTLLVGTARGDASLAAFHCGIVRGIASRQASEQLNARLRNALAEIERRGRLTYAGGSDIADVLDGIELGIEIGGIIGRLRR